VSRVTINDAVEVIIDHRGRTPKKLGSDFTTEGVQVISARNVYGGRLHPRENERFVAPEIATRWMPTPLRRGDVLLTSEAPLGEVAYLKGEVRCCLGQRLFALRARPGVASGRFLYYALSSPRVQAGLYARASGTTAQGIKQSELRQVELDLLPLAEQDRVASVLGALDDKIDSNRRLAELLEEAAATLFRARFIDFVGTEELEETEIGPMPRGWRVRPISDLCDVRYGYTASAVEGPVGPKLLRVKDINKEPWIDWTTVPYCEIDEDRAARFRLLPGDLVIARMADPGKTALVVDEVDAVCASYLVRLRPSAPGWSDFLHRYLRSPLYDGYIQSVMSGSVQKNINARVLTAAKVGTPPLGEVAVLAQVLGPMHHYQATCIREAGALAALRDALLPKLVSGEIRVPDTEDPAEVIEPAFETVAAAAS
jgi:type I restriction enzyme, S subunit